MGDAILREEQGVHFASFLFLFFSIRTTSVEVLLQLRAFFFGGLHVGRGVNVEGQFEVVPHLLSANDVSQQFDAAELGQVGYKRPIVTTVGTDKSYSENLLRGTTSVSPLSKKIPRTNSQAGRSAFRAAGTECTLVTALNIVRLVH